MATPNNKSSISAKLRKKRFALFRQLLPGATSPLKILDVGGKETIWAAEGFCEPDNVDRFEITILNIDPQKTKAPNITSVGGDARNMSDFADNQFDIVFSNSVIEHVGDYDSQMQMAREVQRVGKKYFVQTPNFYFPIEPHFLYPFFQFLPLQIKAWILTNIARRHRKVDNIEQAKKIANGIKLLNKRQFSNLFPEATIVEEKFWGLTKSFVAYGD